MGKMKDFLIGVEELVWTAIETGARDFDTVYAYVYMYEPRADEELVRSIMEEMFRESEAEYFWA